MKTGDLMIKQMINGENISIILFFTGVYGLCTRRNIIKTIMSLSIMQVSVILFFISINSEHRTSGPIGKNMSLSYAADPLPQALMITAVVIGISVTAISLTMFIAMAQKYGTTNWKRVKTKRGESD